MASISDNIEHVREAIACAAGRSGRSASEVMLVAITKNVDASRITEAVSAGVQDLGENRVQEATLKIPLVSAAAGAGSRLVWHLVGHLQRNKAKRAAELFTIVHSLDSEELADELNRKCEAMGRTLDVLLQVNISGEATKSGIRPEDARAFAIGMPKYEHLRMRGIMTIAPYSADPELARPVFREARRLVQDLSGLRLSNVSLDHISMGMSGDYAVAVEEGATIVRVGSAIFGPRTY
ncbi:MAG: YggS family pyridoxal phosphate-dependent enzyme [Clostridia bacterium]|nr:YggS family pyridoxal phosphate-dependent enzyme [Clostridia bacterium]